MKNRNTARSIEEFAAQAEAPQSKEQASRNVGEGRELPEGSRARMNMRLNAATRKHPVATVLGNNSVKALIDYAADVEGRKPQDLIRAYFLLTLEEKYGDQVPLQEERE